jgi:excisionase family DNA binding protein
MSENIRPVWFDYNGAADYLGRDRAWLKVKCDQRVIAYYVVGRHRRFLRNDLDAYLASVRRPAVGVGGGDHAA